MPATRTEPPDPAVVAQCYREEGSRARTAARLGVSEWQVARALARAGVETRPQGPPGHARLRALDWHALYREHGSYRRVARAVGCNPSTAKDHLIASGAMPPDQSRRWTEADVIRVLAYADRHGMREAARVAGMSVPLLYRLRDRLRKGEPMRDKTRRKPRVPGRVNRDTAARAEARAVEHARRARVAADRVARLLARLDVQDPAEQERRRAERSQWHGALT